MLRDEIVDEVRTVRRQLMEQAGGDLEHLFQWLKEGEASEQRPLVSLPPQRPTIDRTRVA